MADCKWSDCQYAQFTRKPTAEMLTPEGVEVARNVSMKGEPKSKVTRTALKSVLYDRDYVVHWLATWIGPLVLQVPRSDFLKLITEAKEIAKTKQ